MSKFTNKIESLFNAIDAEMEGTSYSILSIVANPKGNKQEAETTNPFFTYVYVDQTTGHSCDDYYGTMYFPIDDKYIAVNYSC